LFVIIFINKIREIALTRKLLTEQRYLLNEGETRNLLVKYWCEKMNYHNTMEFKHMGYEINVTPYFLE
jgi:hypothetical protein